MRVYRLGHIKEASTALRLDGIVSKCVRVACAERAGLSGALCVGKNVSSSASCVHFWPDTHTDRRHLHLHTQQWD
ncbi:hypothetical protein B566_EDAN017553 [Ephemera danica]|nr:hypothetical protein B566_EDAN017553 [Ephemera danica]